MSKHVGEVKYKATVDDSGVDKDIDKVESKFKKAAKGIASAFAAYHILDTIKDIGDAAIQMGGKLEQAIGGIETLFGAGGLSIEEYASKMGKSIEEVAGEYDKLQQAQELALSNAKNAWQTAGLSANDYMENITSFAASLKQSLGGDALEAAKVADRIMVDISDNTNKMGTDMALIQNAYQGFAKQNYMMLDNLKLGYGGTKTEMERLIKDASKMTDIQQKLGLEVKEGQLDFANIANAISVVQYQLGITGTTAKEATTTLQGSSRAMKSAFDNLLGAIALGENVKPYLDSFVESVRTYLGNLIPMIGNVANGMIEVLIGKIPDFLSSGAELINGLASGMVERIPTFIEEILPRILEFTEHLRENAERFVEAGANLIISLVNGLIKGLPSLIAYIPEIVINIAGVINDNMPLIIKTGFDVIVALIKGIIDNIPNLIANMGRIVTAIVSVINATNWLALGSQIMRVFASGISALFSAPVNLVRNIAQSIYNTFRSGFNWGSLGSNIISGIANGIAGGVGRLVNAAVSAVSRAFNAAKSWLGIHSPSTRGRDEIGKNLIAGEAEGISENEDMLKNALTDANRNAFSDFTADVNYNIPEINGFAQDLGMSFAYSGERQIVVPLMIDGREIARATAWDMGEQLAWEER